MIDKTLIDRDRLVDTLLDNVAGNVNKWLAHVEIVPEHVEPFDREQRKRCVVRFGKSFLRYSEGPRQGFIWDLYGDDFLTPELALLAAVQAPIPPWAIKPEYFKAPAVPEKGSFTNAK